MKTDLSEIIDANLPSSLDSKGWQQTTKVKDFERAQRTAILRALAHIEREAQFNYDDNKSANYLHELHMAIKRLREQLA